MGYIFIYTFLYICLYIDLYIPKYLYLGFMKDIMISAVKNRLYPLK